MLRYLPLVILIVPAAQGAVTEAMKSSDTVSSCVRLDDVALYRFGPSCKETIVRAGRPSEMSYNKLGLRDKDYPPKPRAGWTRILFIGSSVLAGPGVAEHETPARRLEQRLRRTNKKVEVINAGVEGYSSLQLAAMTPRWIEAYNPTHVLLYLEVGQSANADPGSSIYAEWGPEETVKLETKIFPLSQRIASAFNLDLNVWLDKRKVLTSQVMGHRALFTVRCLLRNRAPVGRTRCMLAPTIRSLRSIHQHAKKSGAKFLFLIGAHPFNNDLKISPGHDLQMSQFFDRLTPRMNFAPGPLNEVVNELGIPMRPFSPSFGTQHTLPGDYHLGPLGTDNFAEQLLPIVQDFLKP